MFCVHCGTKINDGDKTCTTCGKSVTGDLVEGRVSQVNERKRSKTRSLVVKILIAVTTVALLVGGWFGRQAYDSFREKREKLLRRQREEQEELRRQQREERETLQKQSEQVLRWGGALISKIALEP